ncbi:MAG: glutathione S-transferase family protein [Pseudomonadota bacterium]
MSELVLYGAPQSNFVWACRLALTQKGVAYRLEPARPHTPDVDAIHPLGRIPVMRHGDVALCESRAIVLYVDRAFDGPALQAADPATAAREEAVISLLNTGFDQVMLRQYVFAYVFPGTADGSPDLAKANAALPQLGPQLEALDKAVGEGVLLGDTFRLVDAWAIPTLYYVSRMPDWDRLTQHTPTLRTALEKALNWPVVEATTPPPVPSNEAPPVQQTAAAE